MHVTLTRIEIRGFPEPLVHRRNRISNVPYACSVCMGRFAPSNTNPANPDYCSDGS